MIKPEMVPDEVVEAFVDAFHGKDMTRKAAIAAALNAWPGMRVQEPHSIKWYPTVLILPIPQEASDGA